MSDSDLKHAVDDALTRTVAIAGLGGIALIHALQVPAAFSETFYLGLLFCGAVVVALALAATMTRTSDPRTLETAGGFAGLLLLLYVISRCFGLPAATEDVGNWTEPLGLASMVVEGMLVFLAAVAMPRLMPRMATAPELRHGAAGMG